jgi:hypothetical protein
MFEEETLAELFLLVVESLGDAIGVENQGVPDLKFQGMADYCLLITTY